MDEEFKNKVLAESRDRQKLEHPFIQQIIECYNEKDDDGDDCHYVVIPMASGGTLEKAIEQRRNEDRPMQEQELLKLFAMLALAMEETHSQGWLHRNVSSAHVYLNNNDYIARLASHANITFKEWWEKVAFNNKLWCEQFYLSPLSFAGEKYGP